MEILIGAVLVLGIAYIIYRVVNRKKAPKPPYVGGGTGGPYQDEVR